jgi:hypothetical protein
LSLTLGMAFLLFCQARTEKKAEGAGLFAVLCRKRGYDLGSGSVKNRAGGLCAMSS